MSKEEDQYKEIYHQLVDMMQKISSGDFNDDDVDIKAIQEKLAGFEDHIKAWNKYTELFSQFAGVPQSELQKKSRIP